MKLLTAVSVTAALMSTSIASSMLGTEYRNPTAMLGAGLLEVCISPDPEIVGFCHGYLQGVHDAFADEVCAPPSVSRAQIAEAVVEILYRNEEMRQLYAGAVVYALLIRSFPCE